MTLGPAVAFFRLHLINADLGTFAVFYNISRNRCSLNIGSTDFDDISINNRQDLFELNIFACGNIKLLYIYHITLGDAVLFSARYYDCILHKLYPFQNQDSL